MSDAGHNKRIEALAAQIKSGGTSPDETDPVILAKYHNYAKSEFGLDDDGAAQLVFESLVYLKLHSTDMDPLSSGEKFGVGFS